MKSNFKAGDKVLYSSYEGDPNPKEYIVRHDQYRVDSGTQVVLLKGKSGYVVADFCKIIEVKEEDGIMKTDINDWKSYKADQQHQMSRLKVFGGWLVRSVDSFENYAELESNPLVISESMAFVPDPNHEWEVEND